MTTDFDPQHPVCREGIEVRALENRMVYIRHPEFSSRIINREWWEFLQLCNGRGLEELNQQIQQRLGVRITLEQLRGSVDSFARNGWFEGTKEADRHYRVFDATKLSAVLAPLVQWAASTWFAAITVGSLAACIGLLIADWGAFTDEVARAVRQHPVATVILYYVAFIPVALLHELGHAIVVRYNGGEVPEVVIRRNAHFAVLSNTSVLKEQSPRLWYLSMGTVVDIYIWLALLIAFHFFRHYVVLVFLLPQTIYFLLFSYSIFKNSDYLKIISTWFAQPIPARPWNHLRDSWRKLPESAAARRLLYLMTASLALKLMVTAFLIWTFAVKEYWVLILYAVYRLLVYLATRPRH